MQRIFTIVLTLSLAAAGTARAQQLDQLTVRPGLGLFAPLLPLVSVDDGQNADVELFPGSTVGLELSLPVDPRVEAYGGAAVIFTRLDHGSGVLELRDIDPDVSSRVNLFVPTVGVLLRPLPDYAVQPLVRLGAGAKLYDFDLFDIDDPVSDFAGDVGLGVTADAGPSLSLTAEGRWLPSNYDPRFLPIRLAESAIQSDQFQNDWVFQATVTFRPAVGGQ